MSDKSNKVIRVSDETHRALKVWAVQAGMQLNEAAEALIEYGVATFPVKREQQPKMDAPAQVQPKAVQPEPSTSIDDLLASGALRRGAADRYTVDLKNMPWNGWDEERGEMYDAPLTTDGKGCYWSSAGDRLPPRVETQLEKARAAGKIEAIGLEVQE